MSSLVPFHCCQGHRGSVEVAIVRFSLCPKPFAVAIEPTKDIRMRQSSELYICKIFFYRPPFAEVFRPQHVQRGIRGKEYRSSN